MIYKFFIFLFFPLILFAAPAMNKKTTFKNADGSTFTGKLNGDEYFSWIESDEGELVLYNKALKQYEYANIQNINNELELKLSGKKVSKNKVFRSVFSSTNKTSLLKRKDIAIIWKRKRNEYLKRKQ